jgi:hypothetical protein
MKLGTAQDRQKSLAEELGRIVKVIQSEYDPEKVVLFGSLASDAVQKTGKTAYIKDFTHEH